MSAPSGGGGASYDISASVSESATQGFQSGGAFTVGGNKGANWWPLALLVVAAIGLVLWFKRKK